MYSAGVVLKDGSIIGRAFATKFEAEDYIISIAEKQEIKQARIKNLQTGEEEIVL